MEAIGESVLRYTPPSAATPHPTRLRRATFPSRGRLGGLYMNDHYNAKLTGNAKRLRREMTREERHLWYDFLKQLPVTVHRQKILGHFITDFYIASSKLVIELDGSQHYEEDNRQRDRERDAWLESEGYVVLRYSNADIKYRFSGVCEDILNHL